MKLNLELDHGYLPDQFGKYASVKLNGLPVESFPFTISELAPEAKYLAWSFVDFDSTPVCGFTWIHWLVADVPATQQIPADFSRQYQGPQGYNSNISKFLQQPKENTVGYVGPTPPDKDHYYTLRVYALKEATNLQGPFYYNEFLRAIEGKVVDEARIDVLSRA